SPQKQEIQVRKTYQLTNHPYKQPFHLFMKGCLGIGFGKATVLYSCFTCHTITNNRLLFYAGGWGKGIK
ncbi:hypothetical protein, partial [uncultured Desulfovibrio sp.]|uniref:hypothetical protein n=1 Tax=uncultured Desulfovibrio sp. TaxID=167968 RepID=UPI0026195FD1